MEPEVLPKGKWMEVDPIHLGVRNQVNDSPCAADPISDDPISATALCRVVGHAQRVLAEVLELRALHTVKKR